MTDRAQAGPEGQHKQFEGQFIASCVAARPSQEMRQHRILGFWITPSGVQPSKELPGIAKPSGAFS